MSGSPVRGTIPLNEDNDVVSMLDNRRHGAAHMPDAGLSQCATTTQHAVLSGVGGLSPGGLAHAHGNGIEQAEARLGEQAEPCPEVGHEAISCRQVVAEGNRNHLFTRRCRPDCLVLTIAQPLPALR